MSNDTVGYFRASKQLYLQGVQKAGVLLTCR